MTYLLGRVFYQPACEDGGDGLAPVSSQEGTSSQRRHSAPLYLK
jgi:hypothetical protein